MCVTVLTMNGPAIAVSPRCRRRPASRPIPMSIRHRVEENCQLAANRAPVLLAFHIYVTDDESFGVFVQIHPAAAPGSSTRR